MPRPRAHVSDLFQALAVFFAGHATASFPCFLSHLSGCRHRRTVDIAACRGYIWRFCGVFLRVPGIKIVSLPPPRFLHFLREMVFESCFSCAAYLPLATVRHDIGVDYRLAKISISAFFPYCFSFTYRADVGRRLGLDRRCCRPGFGDTLCLPASPNFYGRRWNEGRATAFQHPSQSHRPSPRTATTS